MELITQYSRAYRRAYERSISEQKYENHPHFSQDDFLKGQSFNLRKIQENCSYQRQENGMRYDDEDCDFDRAKDLRIDKSNNNSSNGYIGSNSRRHQQQQQQLKHQMADCITIKQEIIPPIPTTSPQPPLIRRYFCIFCKLDYLSAEDFLEHLELHPNGSFVLVKRELSSRSMPISSSSSSPPPPLPPPSLSSSSCSLQRPCTSPKNLINHHNLNNNNDMDDLRTKAIINGKEPVLQTPALSENVNDDQINDNDGEGEEEEDVSNLQIIPEVLKNQIKIEPISEDDDEDDENDHINKNHVVNNNNNKNINNNNNNNNNNYLNHQIHDAPQYNSNNNSNNVNIENNDCESNGGVGGDPNQQLLVLSNPRIGDGPGEYLCNVCQAKFVYKNNLKSHLKRHLGIYPYVCFCGKRYQFKCKLNKHIEQAHAKIKNFKCPVPTCPKKYFTRNDLAFHISVTHQERQEIPCNICQKVFNSQKSLQIHCRKYHRNQES